MESALRAEAGADGLKLIETVLWDGETCPRIEGHMARLTASAAALGWRCDEAAARTALTAPPGAAARLRLTLDRNGLIDVICAALPASPAEWRLGPAKARLDSTDPWLRHKTTRRGIYDAARATMTDRHDELVFLNERNEICDGTITTLFFDLGQGLRTPPISSGLLAGVLRSELLADGSCREELLTTRDMPNARLWVGNALRGLMPAVWRGMR